APTTTTEEVDGGCYLTVNPNGRLSIVDAADAVPTAAVLARRSIGGTVHRVTLTAGITAWLHGDDHDGTGELNWAATQMGAALAATAAVGPDHIPIPCRAAQL